MSSLPSKASFLANGVAACQPPDDLECPICREGFEAEGQKSDEREQVTSEPKPATSAAAEAFSSQSPTAAATSNQSSTAQETSRQPSTADTTQSQSATATATQILPTTDAADSTPLQVPCCKKIYCRACLYTWLEEANTCPTCRAVLFEQDPDFELYEPLRETNVLPSIEDGIANNNEYMDIDGDDYDEESDLDDGYDSNG